MTPETPATGILKQNDYGDFISYHVSCECMSPDHAHTVVVEADEFKEVAVMIYTTATTPFWSIKRWTQMWKLLTKGKVDMEATVILNKQQAINYAHTLLQAVKDVQK